MSVPCITFRGHLLNVDELLTDVGYAADVDDVVRFAKGLVSGVAVGLDVTLELTQKVLGDRARPRRVVAINHGRQVRIATTEEPLVAAISIRPRSQRA